MTTFFQHNAGVDAALAFQKQILPQVSRSFALTIPQLPDDLEDAVANAYLLCRIVDTLEDDPAISLDHKGALLTDFIQVLRGQSDAAAFARNAGAELSYATPATERALVMQSALVVAVFQSFSPAVGKVILTCVETMSQGMLQFQGGPEKSLETIAEFNRYCYFVAGVVGELLTEMFCNYAPDIEEQRQQLERFSISFGQGLQMTNILKDVWDDLERGYCWLPRELFSSRGYDLDQLDPAYQSALFRECQTELIGIAHGHLYNALEFTLAIPRRHRGIRVFCLWAIGLALPTLQLVHRSPAYYQGQTVKVSKTKAVAITGLTSLLAGNNFAQRRIFSYLGWGMPLHCGNDK